MMTNILVDTTNMCHEKWLEVRRTGICGSDCASILGLNPWTSSIELWMDKTGKKLMDKEVTESMFWGTRLEDTVRDFFAETTGKTVKQIHAVLQHPEVPYLLANIDGLTETDDHEPAILEVKTVSAYGEKNWENGIPINYELQIRHYLMVTGLRKAYCIALFGGNHTKIYEIDTDDAIEAMLLQEEQKWWSYVVNSVTPPMDASDAAKELLDSTFKGGNTEEVELPEEAQKYFDMYFEGQAEAETAKEKIQLATNNLKQYLKDNEVAVLNDHKVTWKSISSERLDSKRLKEELPDIYEQYTKKSESRRFTVK